MMMYEALPGLLSWIQGKGLALTVQVEVSISVTFSLLTL